MNKIKMNRLTFVFEYQFLINQAKISQCSIVHVILLNINGLFHELKEEMNACWCSNYIHQQ